ncbi:uncharacterized protein [Paramisgurnus dabryanus]|uniref:uncharacterized protein n=1 Tax=Paramisgurnus dabryanus TaxID=90735 RepID=UPI0031F3E960
MFAVSVSGVVLVFLLHHTTLDTVNGQNIDSNTLARIFTFFEQNYKIVENEAERQYALAINVLKEQCQDGFIKDKFLTHENPEKVKSDMSNEEDPVYEGTDLIGAGTKVKGRYKIHSESLLLNLKKKERTTTPMQDLLNRRNVDSCTVFYTLNSPCANTCLDKNSKYNILHGLETWSAHPSIKALVFKQIWKFDKERKEVFEAALREIVNRNVPVYRCINETNVNVCYACGGIDDAPIDEHCLHN